MAIRTAATANAVVRPAISISRRTRANKAACSGVGSGATVSVMQNSSGTGFSLQQDVATGARRLELTIAGDEASIRLDRVLAAKVQELSRSRLKALILAGQVSVKSAPVRDPAYHVAAGDTIIIEVRQAVPAEPAGEDIALAIVYEDDYIIVIDKPRGLVVHPAAGNQTGTLVNALIAHCGVSLSGIGGGMGPGIVPRLDKDTSGLLVVAKTDRAHRGLSAQFADHGRSGPLERGYFAIVWGAPARREATIAAALGRSPRNREKMAILASGGREAITHYRVADRYGLRGSP